MPETTRHAQRRATTTERIALQRVASRALPTPADIDAAVAWLGAEFPDWQVEIDRTATWHGELRPLWIARRDGHHPQAELTAAKLHSRLTDYLEREARRRALSN